MRSMTIPLEVDPNAVTTEFKNGVLEINVQKHPALTKQPKKVEDKCAS